MRRFLLALALMSPTACFASGNPGVIWSFLGSALAYLVVAAVLIARVIRREVGWPRLLLFVVAGVAIWYWYLNSKPENLLLQTLAVVATAVVFLIRFRRT